MRHRAAGEQRHQRHERDERQVLEQQDGEAIAPGAALQQVALAQHGQHDGGGGQGEPESECDRTVPADAGDPGAGGQDQPGDDDLRRAQPEHGAAHDP